MSRRITLGTTDTSERFSRTISGRQYPAAARDADRSACALPHDDLCNQIEATIRARWRTKEKASDYHEYEDLVSDYMHDMNVLRDAVREFRAMIVGSWSVNTQFHCQGEADAQARDSFLSKHEGRLSSIVDQHLIAPAPRLEAKLERMPLALRYIELQDALDKGVKKFAEQVVTLLDTGVDRGMIGVANWATDTACDVSYYRNIVIQEDHGSQIVRAEERVVGIREFMFGYAEQIEEKVFRVSRGQHLLRRGRYDLYLSQAASHRIEDGKVVIPHDVGEFLDSLPAWIRGMARVVEGKELKRLLVVMDVERERYEDTRVVAVRFRERKHYCPVVTIGHYVLTGWSGTEESCEVASRWAWQMRVIAILLLFLAVGLCCLGQLLSAAFRIVATAAAVLSLITFWESERQRAISNEGKPDSERLFAASLMWGVSAAALMALFAGITGGNGMLTGTGLSCLLLMAAFLVSRSTPPQESVVETKQHHS
jgi:hypothetical protein